mmetsp:Transcript_42413/g.109114  ORF Transcript_42413/g.109114 Transcript_42413/m.109114 type:complete len:94 (+) Transcript_42413:1022-1303(+)
MDRTPANVAVLIFMSPLFSLRYRTLILKICAPLVPLANREGRERELLGSGGYPPLQIQRSLVCQQLLDRELLCTSPEPKNVREEQLHYHAILL